MLQDLPVHIQPALPAQELGCDFRNALGRARSRDAFGDKVHLALAMAHVAMIPLATAPAGISFGLLLFWTMVRLPHTWPCYQFLLKDRLLWVLILWCLWTAASLLWSLDPDQGLKELTAFRAILTPFMLLPVIDRISWLVVAFLLGVVAQNAVQLGQWMKWWPRERDGDRIRGLVHPIITATMCAAAMCWHLCSTLRAASPWRWLSLFGFLLAGLGALFTGSRGPWIAAVAAITFGLIFLAWRFAALRLRIVLLLAVIGAAAAIVTPFSSKLVTKRFEQAVSDMEKAMNGQYRTNLGERIARWNAAWEVWREHPIAGVGAGGYHKAVHTRARVLRYAYHAHSVYFHVLACTGIIGALLAGVAFVMAFVRMCRHRADSPFAEGFVLILIVWLIGGAFDAYQLNGLDFALFGFIVAGTLPLAKAAVSPSCSNDSGVTKS